VPFAFTFDDPANDTGRVGGVKVEREKHTKKPPHAVISHVSITLARRSAATYYFRQLNGCCPVRLLQRDRLPVWVFPDCRLHGSDPP
jgi:hypothetical protein